MTEHTDLIVIGAGGAGLSAALTAAERGLSVIVLEKGSDYGGATRIAGGSHCFAGTDIQEALGIEDTPEKLRNDLINASHGLADPQVVDAYVGNQLETYYWLRDMGAPFLDKLKASPGSSLLRTHLAAAGPTMEALHARVMATGRVDIRYETAAERLITQNGHVTGVKAGKADLMSNKGVILSSGGFVASPELLERYAPIYVKAKPLPPKTNTGDGIKLAAVLGADIVETAYIQGNFGAHPNGKKGGVARPIFKGGIAVNARGVRYVDESIAYKAHAAICLMQPGAVTYQIFDQAMFDQADETDAMFGFRSRYDVGDIVSAPTLAALAQKLDLPPATLEDTVARYNANIAKSSDPDFGRKHIQGNTGTLVPLGDGPFYGYPSTVLLVGTYCGVRVNAQMEAVDVFGDPIKGLYAVGEITGAFHGKGELPGSALTKAFVFGRLAAQVAATA